MHSNIVELADRLRALHAGPRILVLPNAWDCASARVFEDAGFPAIATTSAGVAFALGYPDVQRIGRDEMFDAVRRITASVRVPVTADIEAAYGETPGHVAESLRALADTGAVGCNIEDTLGLRGMVDEALQVEKIHAAKQAAPHLVINARTDVYLFGIGEEEARFDHAVRRANAYRAAGADSLFVPGVSDAATIRRLASAIDGPLNILAGAGAPSISELEQLGVRRVSIGSGGMRAVMALTRRIATELRDKGTYESLTNDQIPYLEANRLMERGY